MEKDEWLKKMQHLLNECPKGHWLFCDGNLHLMKYKQNRERAITESGGMDQNYIVGTLSGPEMDGGDW